MDWNSTIKYQSLQQPPETSTEGANDLVRNKKQYAMNTQWHCELLSYAYVPILQFEVGSDSQPLSGAAWALSSHPVHHGAHCSLLHSHLSSQHCCRARRVLGLAQPHVKHSCKQVQFSVCSSPQTNASHCWLEGGARLHRPKSDQLKELPKCYFYFYKTDRTPGNHFGLDLE